MCARTLATSCSSEIAAAPAFFTSATFAAIRFFAPRNFAVIALVWEFHHSCCGTTGSGFTSWTVLAIGGLSSFGSVLLIPAILSSVSELSAHLAFQTVALAFTGLAASAAFRSSFLSSTNYLFV